LARRDFRDAEGGGNPPGWIIDDLGLRDFAAQVHNPATASFARIAIRTDEPPRVLPPRDGVLLTTRFRHAIGAE
jgi:phosphonopyruvate decarboxylase